MTIIPRIQWDREGFFAALRAMTLDELGAFAWECGERAQAERRSMTERAYLRLEADKAVAEMDGRAEVIEAQTTAYLRGIDGLGVPEATVAASVQAIVASIRHASA